MPKDLSFCIINYGHSAHSLNRCVDSILRQNLPGAEILVAGTNEKSDSWEGAAKEGAINKLRNLACAKAKNETIVLIEPNVELADDWYASFSREDFFDVTGSAMTTLENKRCVDWATSVKLGDEVFPFPLQYDEWTTRAYIRADLMALKKKVWEMIRFNEGLLLDGGDDADFCLRASEAGFRLGVIPEAKAVCHPDSGVFARRRHVTFEESAGVVRNFRSEFSAGKSAYNAGDYAKALKCFDRAVKITGTEPEAWSWRGWSGYFLGMYDDAIKAFDEAIRLDFEGGAYRRGRGWAYLQKGRYQEAIADLKAALEKTGPEDKAAWAEILRGLGWAHYHERDFEKAVQSFNVIIEKTDPNEKDILRDAFIARGWSYSQKRDFPNAADSFEKAIENAAPENKGVIEEAFRGLRLAHQGKSEELSGAARALMAPAAASAPGLLRPRLRSAMSVLKRKIKNGLKLSLGRI